MRITRSRSRTAKWSLFFSYIGQVLAFVSGILMVPLYLRSMSLETYGLWLATGNVLAWLTVVDPGISALIQQRVAHCYGRRDMTDLADYANSGVVLSFGIAVVIIIAGVVGSLFLEVILDVSAAQIAEVKAAFLWTILGTGLMIVSYSLSAVILGMQSGVGTGVVHAVAVTFSLVLTYFLLRAGWGVQALGIAALVRALLFVIGNLAYLAWRIRAEGSNWHARTARIREVVSLGLSTFWARAINVLVGNLDALLAARFLGPEVVPLLSLTKKAPEYCRSVAENPVRVVLPIFSEMRGAGEAVRLRATLLRMGGILAWILGLFLCGFVALNHTFVGAWVGPQFYAGNLVNVLICLLFVVAVGTYAASSFSFALGAIVETNRLQVIQGLVMICLMWGGVRWFGMVGLVAAPLLAMLAVGAWAFPRLVANELGITRGEVLGMLLECGKALLVALAVIATLSGIAFDGYNGLAMGAAAAAIAYATGLALVSGAFRSEIRAAGDKVRRSIADRGMRTGS